jgi:hypothetical protein
MAGLNANAARTLLHLERRLGIRVYDPATHIPYSHRAELAERKAKMAALAHSTQRYLNRQFDEAQHPRNHGKFRRK